MRGCETLRTRYCSTSNTLPRCSTRFETIALRGADPNKRLFPNRRKPSVWVAPPGVGESCGLCVFGCVAASVLPYSSRQYDCALRRSELPDVMEVANGARNNEPIQSQSPS